MTTPKAVWGTFQALRKVLALLQDIHYFRMDRQTGRGAAWSSGRTAEPAAPASTSSCLVGSSWKTGKHSFFPHLVPSHSLSIPLVWIKRCSAVTVFIFFCLRISFCAKSKYVLGGIFLFFPKKKMKKFYFPQHFVKCLCGKKRIKCFLMAKKKNQNMQIWGIL